MRGYLRDWSPKDGREEFSWLPHKNLKQRKKNEGKRMTEGILILFSIFYFFRNLFEL